MHTIGDMNMTTRVADLTVDDLRSLIQEVVTQTMEDLFRDPDEGLELREDFRSAVQQSLIAIQAEGDTISAHDVATRLGLSWYHGASPFHADRLRRPWPFEQARCSAEIEQVPMAGGESRPTDA